MIRGLSSPAAGLSLTARHAALVSVAQIGWRGWSGRRLRLDEHRLIALPPGLLQPSPIGPNIADPEALADLLRPLVSSRRLGRVAMSLPDLAATVILLPWGEPRMGQGGSKVRMGGKELDAFIRWQAERFLPYPPTEARFAWQALPSRLLVVAIKEAVVAQYEAVMARLGLRPVVVDLASFHLFNLYAGYLQARRPQSPDAGWVFMAHAETSLTLMLFVGGSLEAIRLKRLPSAREAASERVYRELVATLTAYSEGHDLSRVTHLFVTGAPPGPEGDRLEHRVRADLRLEVERLEPRRIAGVDGILRVAETDVPPLTPALAAAIGR